MALSFYELGTPPPRVENINRDLIMNPEERKRSEFFKNLERLVRKRWVRWGTIGIITSVDARDANYGWYYGSEVDPAVERFIDEVEGNPSEYLLIGNLAAHLFRTGRPPKCMVMAKHPRAGDQNVWFGTWHDPDTLAQLIGTDGQDFPGLSARWQNYIDLVSHVTRGHEDAIIYIPVVAQPPRRDGRDDSVLAGGLVWCVRDEDVEHALSQIAEAQLFLRWQLSELLGRTELLGLSKEVIDPDHDMAYWFDNRQVKHHETAVPHNWKDFYAPDLCCIQHQDAEERIDRSRAEIERRLRVKLGEYNEATHNGLKQFARGTEVSLTSLYLTAAIAAHRRRNAPSPLVLDPQVFAHQSALLMRTNVGAKMIALHIRVKLYDFVIATTLAKDGKTPILEKIHVDSRRVTLTYDDPFLAKGLNNKLEFIFKARDGNLSKHDASGPLSDFIIWSGSAFDTSPCMEGIGHRSLCVRLYGGEKHNNKTYLTID